MLEIFYFGIRHLWFSKEYVKQYPNDLYNERMRLESELGKQYANVRR
jgi:hypothetical protein